MGRNTSIERLRFLAACGIIWFHMGVVPYRSIGYAGLPVFLMVYSALIVQRSVEEPFREFVSKRFTRLLLPWIFWSAVYAVFLIVKYSIKSKVDDVLPPRFYLIGSCIHLWFLPYAFLMGLFLYGIHRGLWGKLDRRYVVLGMIVIAYLVWILGAYLLSDIQYSPPIGQWIFGFPGILLGAAIGYSVSLSICSRVKVLVGILILSIIVALIMVKGEIHNMVVPYGVGIPCVCLAFLFPGKSDPISHFLASLTYGIYLVHPMVGSIINFLIFDKMPVYCIALLELLGSLLVVTTIQRTTLRRFV